jgi:site-specific recombinase XerD
MTGLLTIQDVGARISPASFYLAGLAKGPSRRSMANALQHVARMLGLGNVAQTPWPSLKYAHMQALRAVLVERALAPRTCNRYLAAVRGVLRECFRLGLMSHDAYKRAGDVAPVPGSRLQAGRALSSGELRALFAICDARTRGGRRDAAMLACAYGALLRRAELVQLELGQVHELDGGYELRVRGKGSRARAVPLGSSGARALRRWLAERAELGPGPVFVRLHAERFPACLDALTGQAVADLLARRLRAAGLEHATPHDLRRTGTGDLLDAGADLRTVQRMLGHASPTTTATYDLRPARVMRRAAELLVVPIA